MYEVIKHGIHPMVQDTIESTTDGIEPIELDEFAIEDLTEALKRWFGHPDLRNAVVDLVNLAKLFKEQGSPRAALTLIKIVMTANEES